MSNRPRLYSLKKASHWFWRTNVTREQVLGQVEELKIGGDWLVCPLGEAGRAISIEDFAANPDVFEKHQRTNPVHPDERSVAQRGLSADVQPEQAITVASIPRRHDLDALRAIAMLLGIALHGALSYIPLPAAAWPVQDVRQNEAFGIFLAAVHGFRLPLFFLVSGFFTAMLWRKRGLASLLKHRFNRIFLPLAIGMFTIVPAVWVVSIGASISGSQAVVKNDQASLWTAAKENDVEKIKQHLAQGAAPNELDPVSGATSMSMASWRGNTKAIAQLIEGGADVNARNRDGTTPLHGAAMFGKVETARLLVEHGADVNARSRIGETAAETLSADFTRTVVMAGLNGFEVDQSSVHVGREEVARVLRQIDQSSQSPSEAINGTDADNTKETENRPVNEELAGLMLLLTLFPFFHHLWFLWFLCLLVAAFAGYATLAGLLKWKLPAWLVTSPLRYAWLIPLTVIPQSMMGLMYPNYGPDTSAGLLPIPTVLFYYAIFFFFGALYFDCDDSEGRLGRWWPITLPLALLVVFPAGYELAMGGLGFSGSQWLDSPWCRPLAVILQVAYAWLMSFGLMGLFRSWLSQESKTMRYISDSSYWLYLAHLPLIIVAQAVVWDLPMPALVKFALVCIVTSGLLLASYQVLVRYTPIGTLLNGPRKRPASAAA